MEGISKQLSTVILLQAITHYRLLGPPPLLYETYGLFLTKKIYKYCNKEKYRKRYQREEYIPFLIFDVTLAYYTYTQKVPYYRNERNYLMGIPC